MKYSFFIFTTLIFSGFQTWSQLTPQGAIPLMQKGINLGNTLEPPSEGAWNNPPAQEYYFDLYKEAGFQCVRVPVRWDEHTGTTAPYKINETWLKRVEQVLDWGLTRGLFVVVNAHHEEWIKSNYSQANRDRFDSIWSQIAVRLKDKSDRLLFEIINEPYGLTKAQNDDLHKRVLSIIRKTNPTRIVIFQGHNWGGSDELITAAIPNDKYVMGSFHSYDPYLFGLNGEGTWGTTGDYYNLKVKFQQVRDWSDKNKIPVFLGEFGAIRTCDYNSRMKHYNAYVELAIQNGFAYCAWDDGGDFRILVRNQKIWEEIKDIIVSSPEKSPANLSLKVYQDSIIRVTWSNRINNCDTIWIFRRTTSSSYVKIANLKGTSNSYLDVKPFMNQDYYYKITARDSSGVLFSSYPQKIFFPTWVKRIRQSYLGAPAEIPGIIEAENFDKGGEGLAYHDADDTNLAGAYRPDEGVDIYDRNGTGYHIGNAIEGEWYEYLVNVKTSGIYKVDFALAAMTGGGKFMVKVGDVESDTLKALTTLSWLTTKNVSATMNLKSGEQILRFSVIDDPLFNIDRFTFELVTSSQEMAMKAEEMIHTRQDRLTGDFTIQLSDPQKVKLLNLYGITGNLYKSIPSPGITTVIPSGTLPGGVIILQAITGQRKYVKKVVVFR